MTYIVQIRTKSAAFGPCTIVLENGVHTMICEVTRVFPNELGCCPVCHIACPDLRPQLAERLAVMRAYGSRIEDNMILTEG
jgi:hypothetical protein